MKIMTLEKIPSRVTPGKLVEAVIDGTIVGEHPHVYPDAAVRDLISSPYAKYIRSVGDFRRIERPYDGETDLSGKTIFLWRHGGFGDVLFMTPLIRHLKRRFPKAKVKVATGRNYQMVFRENRDVARVYSYPIDLKQIESADFHVHFEGTIEASKDPDAHAVDLFAAQAKCLLGDDEKLPVYAPEPVHVAELAAELEPLRRGGTKLIGVQARASSPIRTYPEHMTAKIIAKLAKKGYAVLVFGLAGHFPKGARRAGVVDLCGKLTMEQTTAALSLCDALIAPDSSLCHFAAAMNVPTVALYGPFPGNVRTRYYPKCVTLEAKARCAPCFTHGHGLCSEARLRKMDWSPCFGTIEPAQIIASLKTLLSNAR